MLVPEQDTTPCTAAIAVVAPKLIAVVLVHHIPPSSRTLGQVTLYLASGIVDRISSVVLQGVSHEGRLIGGGAHNQEPDGDTRRRDSDLDRFGSSDRCNTLRLVFGVFY